MSQNNQHHLEASFLTLAMSLASAAAMSLGLAPEPNSDKTKVDITMARFNIDLLDVLSQKTKGNLTKDEEEFMSRVLADLKMKFIDVSKSQKGAQS